jgi:tetrahydromethanopterin S-methyltransferase subunit C
MSDRWVFLAAFLTLIVIVAGAFAMPQFFTYELLKSLIFLVIALLVFFGEDRYSYMLGMAAPVIGWIFSILLGSFFGDLKVFFGAMAGKSTPLMDTPFRGLAILLSIVLVIVSSRAWHKQVTEKFVGKIFWICVFTSFIQVSILAAWRFTHAL